MRKYGDWHPVCEVNMTVGEVTRMFLENDALLSDYLGVKTMKPERAMKLAKSFIKDFIIGRHDSWINEEMDRAFTRAYGCNV